VETLAAQFKMSTQDVVDRFRQLDDSGLLTGILDDRGKFIVISPEEFRAAAQYVEQRGRLGISELARASGRIINLSAATQQPSVSL
jgi:DDRGK domain-containing protein 1